MKYLYHIEVAPGLEYDCVAEADVEIHCGDAVIVKCERYQDCGTVTTCDRSEAVNLRELEKARSQRSRGRQVEGHRIPDVIRVATERDRDRVAENDEQARSMQHKARERIAAHNLDMKLIHTHCSLDRRLVVFQFSADGRVDFRELLRDLSHQFRTRVELRQIGVRDEAAIQGGIGACGRAFCCATFLRRFNSINVKMAKAQGLSLNPSNISGACGRLKCCLEYEVERYREDARRDRGSRSSENQRYSSEDRSPDHDRESNHGNGRQDNGDDDDAQPHSEMRPKSSGDRRNSSNRAPQKRGNDNSAGENRTTGAKKARRQRSRQNKRAQAGKQRES